MSSSTRQSAIRKAKEYLSVQPVLLDTETTGLDAGAEIVEICVINHSGDVLLNQLVKPKRPIPADATRIHGISSQRPPAKAGGL